MMLQRILRCVTLVLLAGVALAQYEKENGVIVLDDDNFDEALKEYKNLMVAFTAPWCGHCKNLKPAYEQAAKKLASEHDLPLAMIDADANKVSTGKHEVRGFPTIKYFSNGKAVDYQGGRSADDIVNYVVKKSGPPAIPLDSVTAITDFQGTAEAVVVGFFAKDSSTFLEAAGQNDDLKFGIVSDASVIEEFGAKEGDVVVLKSFDDKRSELKTTGSTEAEEIAKFASLYSMRLVTKFSQETSKLIFGGPLQIHALFFTTGDELDADLQEAASASAEAKRSEILHVHVPASEDRVVEWFGITKDDMPTMMIADMRTAVKKYGFGKRELTKESVAQFEQDFLDGKLSPTLKSEEPSDSDTAEPVKVVKGKSFQEIVIDNKKDVLLEMYAPWCGHCKTLAPKYDELAQKVSGVDSLVIAKMDATANEIDYEGAEVQGFPTLFFFPGNNKKTVQKYEGAREVDDMLNWLQEHAHTKFDLNQTSDDKDEL